MRLEDDQADAARHAETVNAGYAHGQGHGHGHGNDGPDDSDEEDSLFARLTRMTTVTNRILSLTLADDDYEAIENSNSNSNSDNNRSMSDGQYLGPPSEDVQRVLREANDQHPSDSHDSDSESSLDVNEGVQRVLREINDQYPSDSDDSDSGPGPVNNSSNNDSDNGGNSGSNNGSNSGSNNGSNNGSNSGSNRMLRSVFQETLRNRRNNRNNNRSLRSVFFEGLHNNSNNNNRSLRNVFLETLRSNRNNDDGSSRSTHPHEIEYGPFYVYVPSDILIDERFYLRLLYHARTHVQRRIRERRFTTGFQGVLAGFVLRFDATLPRALMDIIPRRKVMHYVFRSLDLWLTTMSHMVLQGSPFWPSFTAGPWSMTLDLHPAMLPIPV